MVWYGMVEFIMVCYDEQLVGKGNMVVGFASMKVFTILG